MSLFGQTAVQATKAAKDHNNSKTDHNGEPLYFYDKTIDYDAANDFNLTSVNITHTEMNAMRNGALNRALEAINLVLGRNGVAQPVTFNDFEATTYARIIANETNGDVGYVLFPVDMFCVKDGYRCEINIDHPTYANTTWGAGSESPHVGYSVPPKATGGKKATKLKAIVGHIFFKAYDNHATRLKGGKEATLTTKIVHVGERFVPVSQINLVPTNFDLLMEHGGSFDDQQFSLNSTVVSTK